MNGDSFELRAKRRELFKLIYDLNQDKLRFLAANPGYDVDIQSVFERADKKVLKADIDRMPEWKVDELLDYHRPSTMGRTAGFIF